MKRSQTVVIFLFVLLCLASQPRASWLIDPEKFHVSVHGQISCQECHGEIAAKPLHPDPDNVNKSLNDFFRQDQCTNCHEEIIDEIEAGSHAGEQVTSGQQFNNCIECHAPHYQLSSSADGVKPDPNQPVEKKCSFCHEFQKVLSEMSTEDQACMTCHRQILSEDPQATEKIAAFCFYCHAAGSQKAVQQYAPQPLISIADYASTPHTGESCLACHLQAAAFRHSEQQTGDCSQCHLPHDEKMIGDAHAMVSCQACHLAGITPRREAPSGQILWQRNKDVDGVSNVHHMPKLKVEDSCRSCHFSGNTIGAAAMVLPAKSVICMPCHAATLSVGDTTTILSLIIFVAGFLGMGSIWISGGGSKSGPGNKIAGTTKAFYKTIFSSRIGSIIKALILDGLMQHRLFLVSRTRWILHALVFYPFIFRFGWGFIALVSSLWWPECSTTWVMVDKNHPLTAFLFDLSGLLVIAGVISMIARRIQVSSEGAPSGLPPSDWLAYSLLGGIIIIGFILEGMRMAMTGSPGGAAWAFMGDMVSRFLAGFDLTGIYGYVWYLHAVLTGVFVTYLPFSRMFHMIMAPMVLAANAATDFHSENLN